MPIKYEIANILRQCNREIQKLLLTKVKDFYDLLTFFSFGFFFLLLVFLTKYTNKFHRDRCLRVKLKHICLGIYKS